MNKVMTRVVVAMDRSPDEEAVGTFREAMNDFATVTGFEIRGQSLAAMRPSVVFVLPAEMAPAFVNLINGITAYESWPVS